MATAKKRAARKPGTRISSKHQITIPVETLRSADLQIGGRLTARVDGPGRVILEREEDVLAHMAGAFTGMWEPGELDRMRDEWD